MSKQSLTKQLHDTTTIDKYVNTNHTETTTKNKTIRRINMTTITKTITKKVPTKSTTKKCFICSAVIARPAVRKKSVKPKTPSCKSRASSLYISQDMAQGRGVEKKQRFVKNAVSWTEKQKILPTCQFKDTSKVLGY